MKIIAAFLYIFSLSTGIVYNHEYESASAGIFTKPLRDSGFWCAENIPVDAIIHNPSFTNPATSIAGRQTMVGYEGWVRSHGLANKDVERNNSILSHNGQHKDFHESNVTFVVTTRDSMEFEKFSFNDFFERVYESKILTIYKVLPYKAKQPHRRRHLISSVS